MVRKIVVMGTVGILLGWCSVCLAAIFPKVGEPNRYGLIVGIDKYSYGGLHSLPSCVNDAYGFRNALLLDSLRWSSQNVQTLTDREATKTAIRDNLWRLASTATEGDTVVYYQNSHGGQRTGKETYLCSYDENYEDFELGEDIALFKDGVTVIIIVDACNSGGLYQDVLGTVNLWNFSDNVMKRYQQIKQSKGMTVKDSTAGDSIGWIVSCDYNEICLAGNPYSIFTKYLLDAFSYGDIITVDGDLSFWELFSYAGPKASDENGSQTAQSSGQTVLEQTIAAQGILAPVELPSGGGGGGGIVGPIGAGVSILLSWLKRRRTEED